MRTWDLIKTANRNLFRNKLRTFLTVTAIFVGAFTLTMTNGVGDGMRDYVESQVKNFEGDRVVIVRRKIERPIGAKAGTPTEYKEAENGKSEPEFDPNTMMMTEPQINAAIQGLDGIRSVTPRYNFRGEYIQLEGQEKKYQVELSTLSKGITAKTEAGRGIDGEKQIVIPIGLARTFDENLGTLIGKRVNVGYKVPDGSMREVSLEVAGVATKGLMTNYSSFVDTATARQLHAEQKSSAGPDMFIGFTIEMETNDATKIDAVKKHFADKGFEADTLADNDKRTYDAIGIFKTGMNMFALVALLAASFGIINTLVIAVLERTKEIGLQKALGMGRGKIFAIFSLESVLIGYWGALFGVIGGIIAGLVTNQVLMTAYAGSFEGFRLFAFKPLSLLLIMLLVCGIAFAAGVMPAIRASRLNPIEALRYE